MEMDEMELTIENVALGYGIGTFAWAFIMSLMGSELDRDYLISMLIWPICAVSLVGQTIRWALGKRPRG